VLPFSEDRISIPSMLWQLKQELGKRSPTHRALMVGMR
jgi:hypothetical protein